MHKKAIPSRILVIVAKWRYHANGLLTQRMRETTRVRFPIGFLIFSYPWFSHTYPHTNRICPSTRIRHISRLFLLPRTPLGVFETEHALRWPSWIQYSRYNSDLASTRFLTHSVFKNFHSGKRIEKVADSYAWFTGYVWMKVKSAKKK